MKRSGRGDFVYCHHEESCIIVYRRDGMSREKRMKRKKKVTKWIVLAMILCFLGCSLWSWMPVTERITLDLLKGRGKKVRLVLITDLHNCWYGKGQKDLLNRIDSEKPDIVLIGGDFFDDILPDERGKTVAEALVKKYPCYYVTGNHEYRQNRGQERKEYMQSIGVKVLAGNCETITVNETTLDICGIDDPAGIPGADWGTQMYSAWAQTSPEHVRLLLTHRPEPVHAYVEFDYDLVLAGHAHAGQIMIPFTNRGLYAPSQGLFPKYVSGTYELSNGSILEVSRGLSRERNPFPRFFNHPEVVVLDLV
jgi:predicted MPP superfamily phosphohydrolase